MPWCEDCAKFWNPNTLPPDGTCPSCGRVIGDPPPTGVPWHFWVLIIGTVGYLGWRVVQGFEWLVANDHTIVAVVLGVVLAGLVAFGVRWWFSKDEETGPAADGGAGPGSDAHPGPGA